MTSGPQVSFDAALERFRHHLISCGWPAPIVFVPESSVLLQRPPHALVLRTGAGESVAHAQRLYFAAQQASVPAGFHGVGHYSLTTVAYVRVIREPAQGEDMFISDGLKFSASLPPCTLHFCRSRVHWRFASWAEARRQRRTFAILNGAA